MTGDSLPPLTLGSDIELCLTFLTFLEYSAFDFHEVFWVRTGASFPQSCLDAVCKPAYIGRAVKPAGWSCISALILSVLASSYGDAQDKQKVEEGRYAVLRNGALIAGSEHSWTLWRMPGGNLELEDHFQVDKAASLLFGSMLSPGMPTSPEFRRSLQERVEPSEISALFDPNRQLISLTVSGVKANGSTGIGLKCKSSANAIECAGTGENAKLKFHEPRELFWWYGIPMLLHPLPASGQAGSLIKGPFNIALLSFGLAPRISDKMKVGMKFEPGAKISWGDKPTLEAAILTIADLGADTLVLGEKSFQAQKYRLEIKGAKGDPLLLTAWTAARGLVLAVEDASTPGIRIALILYKNYANPNSAAPAAR